MLYTDYATLVPAGVFCILVGLCSAGKVELELRAKEKAELERYRAAEKAELERYRAAEEAELAQKNRTEKTLNILKSALRYWKEKPGRYFTQGRVLRDYIQFLEDGDYDSFKKKLFKETSKLPLGPLTFSNPSDGVHSVPTCHVGELRVLWLTYEERTASQTYGLIIRAKVFWEKRRDQYIRTNRMGQVVQNDGSDSILVAQPVQNEVPEIQMSVVIEPQMVQVVYDIDTVRDRLYEISKYIEYLEKGDYANVKQLLKHDIQRSRGPFVDAITCNETRDSWINYLKKHWKL